MAYCSYPSLTIDSLISVLDCSLFFFPTRIAEVFGIAEVFVLRNTFCGILSILIIPDLSTILIATIYWVAIESQTMF